MKWNEASVELEVRSTPESVKGAGGGAGPSGCCPSVVAGAALWEGGAPLSGLLSLFVEERIDSLILGERYELLVVGGSIM